MERSNLGAGYVDMLTETISKIFEADVAVVGGGPSGICAAVAAARNGSSTILIEENGCAGGMATMGLVGPFMTCYDKTGEKMIIKGLFEEIINRLIEKGGAIHPEEIHSGTAFTSWIIVGHEHVTPFEPETLKVVLDEMLAEAKAQGLEKTLGVIDLIVLGVGAIIGSGIFAVVGNMDMLYYFAYFAPKQNRRSSAEINGIKNRVRYLIMLYITDYCVFVLLSFFSAVLHRVKVAVWTFCKAEGNMNI